MTAGHNKAKERQTRCSVSFKTSGRPRTAPDGSISLFPHYALKPSGTQLGFFNKIVARGTPGVCDSQSVGSHEDKPAGERMGVPRQLPREWLGGKSLRSSLNGQSNASVVCSGIPHSGLYHPAGQRC